MPKLSERLQLNAKCPTLRAGAAELRRQLMAPAGGGTAPPRTGMRWLSRNLRVSPNTITTWKRGRALPTLREMEQLEKTLGPLPAMRRAIEEYPRWSALRGKSSRAPNPNRWLRTIAAQAWRMGDAEPDRRTALRLDALAKIAWQILAEREL